VLREALRTASSIAGNQNSCNNSSIRESLDAASCLDPGPPKLNFFDNVSLVTMQRAGGRQKGKCAVPRTRTPGATTPDGANSRRSQLKGRGKPPRRGAQGSRESPRHRAQRTETGRERRTVDSLTMSQSHTHDPLCGHRRFSPLNSPWPVAAGDTHHHSPPPAAPVHYATSVLRSGPPSTSASTTLTLTLSPSLPPRVEIISKYRRRFQYYPGYHQTQSPIIPSPDEAPALCTCLIVASLC
jgi:hypothetical protein